MDSYGQKITVLLNQNRTAAVSPHCRENVLDDGRLNFLDRFLLPQIGLNPLKLVRYLPVAEDSQPLPSPSLYTEAELDVSVPLDRSIEFDEGVVKLGVALA